MTSSLDLAPKEVLRKCEDSSSSEGEEVEDQDDDEEGDDSEPVVSEALRRRLMKVPANAFFLCSLDWALLSVCSVSF